ncbi:MAG: hypothetical protein ACYC3S_09795 [Chloroflexota bacterium]
MTSRLRRGVLFGGFTLVMAILIIPLAINVVYDGPVGDIGSALVWVAITALTVFAFYLGYNGWGAER